MLTLVIYLLSLLGEKSKLTHSLSHDSLHRLHCARVSSIDEQVEMAPHFLDELHELHELWRIFLLDDRRRQRSLRRC